MNGKVHMEVSESDSLRIFSRPFTLGTGNPKRFTVILNVTVHSVRAESC
jgi:hypothetical protein